MSKFKLGLQLYTIRDEMEKDMDACLKKVKEMGYDCVEFAGFFGKSAEEVKAILDKYGLDIALFKSYTEGFLSEAGHALNDEEIANLAFSAKLMTLECGVRFLTDYLNGDTYFKTDYPEHNLVRCRTQFKLVEDIEKHLDEMNACVDEIYRRSLIEG